MKVVFVVLVSTFAAVSLNYFYFLDKVAIFAIDSRNYSDSFKVVFFLLLWVSIVAFLKCTHLMSWYKKFIVGSCIGFCVSFTSLLLAFLFFYTGAFSLIGYDLFLKMVVEDPVGHILQFIVLSLMLQGWLYGGVVTLFSGWLVNQWNQWG